MQINSHSVILSMVETKTADKFTHFEFCSPFPDTDNNQEGTSNGSEFEDDVEIYQSLHDNIENVDPNRTIYGPITRYHFE